MFVALTDDMSYRGKDYEAGDIIQVGESLGESLVLNGHDRSDRESFSNQEKGLLSDEEIDAMTYQELQGLVAEHELEPESKKGDDYKASLKAFYASKRA